VTDESAVVGARFFTLLDVKLKPRLNRSCKWEGVVKYARKAVMIVMIAPAIGMYCGAA
jgi:hypothetical protein